MKVENVCLIDRMVLMILMILNISIDYQRNTSNSCVLQQNIYLVSLIVLLVGL